MNTKITNSSNTTQIEEWLASNPMYNCLTFDARITQKTCGLNKDTYKTNLKDECVPTDLLEKVGHCVFKCKGLTEN